MGCGTLTKSTILAWRAPLILSDSVHFDGGWQETKKRVPRMSFTGAKRARTRSVFSGWIAGIDTIPVQDWCGNNLFAAKNRTYGARDRHMKRLAARNRPPKWVLSIARNPVGVSSAPEKGSSAASGSV